MLDNEVRTGTATVVRLIEETLERHDTR
jgi:hypothetical protein